jgi:hypothetical protein
MALKPSLIGDDVISKNRKSHEVTMSSPSLWASFHPLSPFGREVCKARKFY